MAQIRAFLVIGLVCWMRVSPAAVPIEEGSAPEVWIESLFPVPSATGHEDRMTSRIRELLPEIGEWREDVLGSLFLPAPEAGDRAAVTGLDELAHIVGGITEEGYLTLDRVIPAPHALYDTWLAGHPVEIWTESGVVPGVAALPSSHILPRERRSDLIREFSLEKTLLDIGCRSRREARARGIAVLDPVLPHKRISRLSEGRWSGPALGRKTCVALLAYLAGSRTAADSSGSSTLGWLAQTLFPLRRSRPPQAVGARHALNRLSAEHILVLDVFPCYGTGDADVEIGGGPVLAGSPDEPLVRELIRIARESGIAVQISTEATSLVLETCRSAGRSSAGLLLPVKYPASPAEIIDLADVRACARLLKAWDR